MKPLIQKLKKPKLAIDIVGLFPEIAQSYLRESLMQKALTRGLLRVGLHQLRDYAPDAQKLRNAKRKPFIQVDDKPFGGGVGMLLMVEPFYRAVLALKKIYRAKKQRVILLSPRGVPFTGMIAKRWSEYSHLIFLCGRYEGVDERVAEHIADEVISIGDYVLSGGELAALVCVEATARFVPGFLGKQESLEAVRGSFPSYTRPQHFVQAKGKQAWSVPEVLVSGNHRDIETWRREQTTDMPSD